MSTSPVFGPLPCDSFLRPVTPAPILDRVFPRAAFVPVPAPVAAPSVATRVTSASRCEASLAITLEREMRGLRPGSTFGFGGIGGLNTDGVARPAAEPDLTMLSAAAVSDIGGHIVAGLGGWLKTFLGGERGDCGLFVICPSAGLEGARRGVTSLCVFVLDMPDLIEFVFSVCELPWVRVRLATLARELAVGAISVEDGRDLTILPGAFT